MTKLKSPPDFPTPKLDVLRDVLRAFYDARDGIAKTKEENSNRDKQLQALANDLETPPSKLKELSREIRNQQEDSEFEIVALEKRLPALVEPLDGMSNEVDYEHRAEERAYREWRISETNKLQADPKMLDGIRRLKVLLQVSPVPHQILSELGLSNLDKDTFEAEAINAGYDIRVPQVPSQISTARNIISKAAKPDMGYVHANITKRWYEVA